MKKGFTLAEVLITLGIIGVIAALTLPGLLAEYSKLVVETKLKKFYTQINQAIALSEAQYGSREYWYADSNQVDRDADGNPVPGSSTAEKWFMKYIGNNMTVVRVNYDDNARPTFFFKDGTALKMLTGSVISEQDGGMRDWVFYTSYPDKCLAIYGTEVNARGKCAWPFYYQPEESENWGPYHKSKRGFEPYSYGWSGTLNQAQSYCRGTRPDYCTLLIQLNGWKIPDDYPWKVHY